MILRVKDNEGDSYFFDVPALTEHLDVQIDEVDIKVYADEQELECFQFS